MDDSETDETGSWSLFWQAVSDLLVLALIMGVCGFMVGYFIAGPKCG